jgi:O-antigen/teichoic acid export membrane protein
MAVSDAPAPSMARRPASGVAWSTAEMVGTQVISLVIFTVLARWVTPREFGVISTCYAFIFSLKTLLIDNISFVTTRKKNPTDLDYSTTFWLTFGLSLALAVILYVSANTLEALMDVPDLARVTRAMAWILLFIGLSRTHEQRLARTFQYRSLVIRSLGGGLIGGAVGLPVAMAGHGLEALVVQQITTSLSSLALLWLASSWRPALAVSRETVRETGRFMLTAMPTSATNVLVQNTDTLLVAYAFGPVAVGYYSIAKRLRMALHTAFGTPFNSVGYSVLAEAQDNPARLKASLDGMLSSIMLVCTPAFVGAAALSTELIVTAFGPRWVEAGPVFSDLAIAGLFVVLQTGLSGLFTVKRRQIWIFYASIVQLALSVAFFAVLYAVGSQRVGLPFALPAIASLPLFGYMASKLVPFSLRDVWRIAGYPLLGGALMYAVVTALQDRLALAPVPRLVVLCGVGAVVYAAFIAVTKPADVRRLLSLVLQRRRAG